MALDYGFFNGIDRKYDAIQLSRMFDGIINDGVFATVGKQFEVKHVNELLVTVGVGRAWFRHIWSANDTLYPIYLDPAETVIDRFDAIVLETDLINRTAAIKYLKGVPASSAVEPEYSDTQTLHQAPLAVIFRKAGSTSITQLDITSKVGTSKCPLVTAVNPTVTTESMISNWEIEFDNWMTGRQRDFISWMDSQKELFSTWMGQEKISFGIWENTVKNLYDDWFNSTKTGLAITTEKINNFKLGGRNLILGSGSEISTSNYPLRTYQLSEKIIEAKVYILKLWGTLGPGKTHFDVYQNGETLKCGTMVNNLDGTFSLVFSGKASDSSIINDTLSVCPMPVSVGGVISTIKKIKLESGNQETDWTPAPEDVEEYTNTKASEAQNAATEYALAQANLARIEAEAHADGLVNEEEQARINDATEKLNQAKTYAEAKASEAQNAAVSHADNVLNTYASVINNNITNLQNQIDGSITTWFYSVAPSVDNSPANDWTTTDLKNIHLGDLYYDTLTGYSYRWQVVNNVYSWQILTDTDVTKALADAAKAQDTADGKRRVFSTTPTPPYDINDLWVQGISGDILKCTVAKSTGNYNADDWTKASKYTDDSRAILAETNAKTYAETKATEAESSAKAYADTKKTEAEAAAKSYADAQLSLEKIRADAYSDSVLTEAEAYAIEQAEIKLNQAKTYAETKASEAQNAAKAYTDGVLNTYASSMNNKITDLQNQIDGSITTWFYSVAPALNNVPAVNWTTTDLKNIHLGDLYYDTLTGYSYRWQVVNNVYSWQILTDTDVTKALADAAKAQDTADGKRRVFGAQPVPPYDVNDLWVQGTSGDIMKCTVARATGIYIAADWTKASKYTDDSKVNALEIGGRNLLLNSGEEVSNANYPIKTYLMSERLAVGKIYTIKIWGTLGAGKTAFSAWLNGGTVSLGQLVSGGDGTFSLTFTGKDSGVTTGDYIWIYPMSSSVTGVTSSITKIKLERGSKTTDWTPAPEDVDNYTDNAFNQLSQTLTSAINQSKTDIRSEVSEKYYTKGDAAQLVSNMATEFVQTKNEFNFTFTQFTNDINAAIGDANQQLLEIVKYIRFENGDIVLGEVGNELILKIQHDKISFTQGGIEVAYFSNRKLYVTDGEYINSLKVGKYSFFPRANGNLSFKKVVQ